MFTFEHMAKNRVPDHGLQSGRIVHKWTNIEIERIMNGNLDTSHIRWQIDGFAVRKLQTEHILFSILFKHRFSFALPFR